MENITLKAFASKSMGPIKIIARSSRRVNLGDRSRKSRKQKMTKKTVRQKTTPKMTTLHTQVKSIEGQRRILNDEEAKEVSSDDKCFCPVKHVENDIYKTMVYNNLNPVHLDDIIVKIESGSGCEFNFMDEHRYKAFQHRKKTKPELPPSKVKTENPSRQVWCLGPVQSSETKPKKWRPSSSSLKAESTRCPC